MLLLPKVLHGKEQVGGPLLMQRRQLIVPTEKYSKRKLKIPFLKCCLHRNQFLVVKDMFEGREGAAQKHVLLQRQLTVCKQVEKKILGK